MRSKETTKGKKRRTPPKESPANKLRKEEAAEENIYFARRDRELLESTRASNQAAREGVVRKLALHRCPQCGVRLVHHLLDEVAVDECGSCRGIWLARGDLETLSRHEREGFLSRWFRHSLSRLR
jgi:Transcription factor zinc-finger